MARAPVALSNVTLHSCQWPSGVGTDRDVPPNDTTKLSRASKPILSPFVPSPCEMTVSARALAFRFDQNWTENDEPFRSTPGAVTSSDVPFNARPVPSCGFLDPRG